MKALSSTAAVVWIYTFSICCFSARADLPLSESKIFENLLLDEEWILSAQRGLSHWISKLILSKFQSIPYRGINEDVELRVPLLPPIPESLPFPGINLCGFNLDLVIGGMSLYGDLNILQSEIVGLDKLEDDFWVSIFTLRPPFQVNYTVGFPSMVLRGPYVLDAMYDQGEGVGLADLMGDGNLTLSINDAFFRFSASGRAFIGNLEISGLDVDLGFSDLGWSFEGATYDGTPNDLSGLAGVVKRIFSIIWNEQTKSGIIETVRCSLNHTLHNCTLLSLLLEPTCLTLEPSPECGKASPFADFDESFGDIFQTDICNATEPPTEATTPTTTTAKTTTARNSGSSKTSISMSYFISNIALILAASLFTRD